MTDKLSYAVVEADYLEFEKEFDQVMIRKIADKLEEEKNDKA